MRAPSERTINLYNRLVEKQNAVRRILRRVHKNAEEVSGAGRLPALVIPKKALKIRHSYFTHHRGGRPLSAKEKEKIVSDFWEKYRLAKSLFSRGLKSYIGRTVKDGYLELWKDQILFMSGESPEGMFGRFSKEQIESSYMGAHMEVFNMLNQLSPEVFLALLYTGRLIQFKYIYQDMISGMGEKENSWLQQQKDLLSPYRSAHARKELLENTRELTHGFIKSYDSDLENDEAFSYGGNHMSETIKKAEIKQSRSRKRS